MTVQEAIEIIKYAYAFNSENSPLTKALDIAIEGLEEVEQYIALGTVEELKEAREKQVAKKPRTDDEDWLCCRNCNETFSLFNFLNKRNRYCGNCGTKIDWSEKRD